MVSVMRVLVLFFTIYPARAESKMTPTEGVYQNRSVDFHLRTNNEIKQLPGRKGAEEFGKAFRRAAHH